MPQWGMGGEKWQRFTRGPIVISRWIQANLDLNCIYIRVSSHLRKRHINDLKTSKAPRDALKSTGVSGKGCLPVRLLRFFSYTKSADQTIDQAVSDLRKLHKDIADLRPSWIPTDIWMAVILMAACKESKYDMIKSVLGMSDHLTFESAAEHLKLVEATVDSSSSARRGGRRQGQRRNRDLSRVKCYVCDGKGHLMRDCPMRGLAGKNRDAQQS
ncbi:hypothetical protein BDR22DRAFT_258621 [Usnea florida]